MKTITVRFYKSESGKEPVREWLKDLSKVRKLEKALWEVRSDITNKEIARIFFTVIDNVMVLLHGFKKKSKKTPINELNIAKERRDKVLRG